jgi:oligopeptide transport system substrate-binding protein
MTPPGFYLSDGADFNTLFKDHLIDPNSAKTNEAKRLLAKAGYPDGENFPVVELLFNTSESHKLLAEAIQQMWQQNLNIQVKLVSQEFAVFQENKTLGNYAIARGNWFADYPDPMTMLDIWTSNSTINTTGWKNPKFDQLIQLAKKSTGQQRIDLLLDAQSLLMKEAPILPLYYYSDLALISDRVIGWEKSCMGVWYFGNADIKETE